MSYKRISPVPVIEGGTNATSMATTDGVVYYDGTRLVTTAVGTATQVLTSNGAGVAPTFQAAGGGGGVTWNDVTGGSATLAAANGYVADKSTLTTLTMPTNNALGDTIYVVGKGSGGWTIVYTTGQNIIFGSSTTTTTSGSLSSTNANDCCTLVCTTASASAPIFTVMTAIGNLTIA